jgi:hypothetical protein
MENPIIDAIEEAVEAGRKDLVEDAMTEVLAPFHKFGVKDFPTLLRKFEERDRFMQERLAEDESDRQAERLEEQRKDVVKTLKAAGLLKVTEESPLVDAYLALDEGMRNAFVAEQLGHPISSIRVGSSAGKDQPEAKKQLAEEVSSIYKTEKVS